jgi:hypothetical protein
MTTVVLATPFLFVIGHGEVEIGAGRKLVLQIKAGVRCVVSFILASSRNSVSAQSNAVWQNSFSYGVARCQ